MKKMKTRILQNKQYFRELSYEKSIMGASAKDQVKIFLVFI